jgi:branched-chain amino acid transport system permease protein
VLRPLIGEPLISVIMVTFGFASVIRGILNMVWGSDTRPFPALFSPEPFHLGPVPVSPVHLWSFVMVVILLAVFSLFFKYTLTGMAMRATADNQQVALSLGVSVKGIFALSWCIATVVSTLGGIILGSVRGGVDFSLADLGLKVFPVVILGGLDSIMGAIIGGVLIGVLENLSGGYLDPVFGGGVKEVAPFVVLVLILMLRPYGLFGKIEIERV